MKSCIFCKIAAGEAGAEFVFQNDRLVAFRDIDPKAPTHVLIIPRKHIPTVNDIQPEDEQLIGEMFLTAKSIANKENLSEKGYRLVFNCNRDGGQAVYHLHLHLLGGRRLNWPPG